MLRFGLENKGYLRSHLERKGKSRRRVYEIAPLGHKVLRSARRRVDQLFGKCLGVGRTGSDTRGDYIWARYHQPKARDSIGFLASRLY